jgi:hypothetical protein
MTQFFALLAISGVIAASTLTPCIAYAQEDPSENASENVPEAASSEFMADYAPTECIVQFGYVARNNLPERLAQNFTQTMDAVMLNQPVADCDAITGTDDGETKNFNFARADQGVYKVITESAPTYDEQSSLYVFKVMGVQFTPINAEGQLEVAPILLPVGSGLCETDDPEVAYNVFCEFAAVGVDERELAVGHLSYLY